MRLFGFRRFLSLFRSSTRSSKTNPSASHTALPKGTDANGRPFVSPVSSSDPQSLSKPSPPLPSRASKTAINALKAALEMLSGISESVLVPGVNLPFSSILALINKIQVRICSDGYDPVAQQILHLDNITEYSGFQ